MTGKPFKITRVVLSDTAKKQHEESLHPDELGHDGLSTKAADSSSDKKPTYENTDNRTRTVGGAKKGMIEEPGGFRYEAKSKWAPGKTLKLHASRKNRFSLSNEANIGWVEDSGETTPAQYINYLRTKPSIRLRKYKVNKSTNEVIENSEQTLDPFSLNGNKTVSESSLNEKRLPGMTLGGRVRSLVARAAGKFGVLVDENGKFRCPPGTPAANQFTDMTGKNCFVFVADQIVAHARNIASGLSSGEGIKNTAKNLYNFVSWLDNGAIPGIGRTVWRDENGKRIRNIKKWREARQTQFGKTFVNGMVRAQDRLEQQDKTISELLSGLGVDSTDEKKKTNTDLIEAFDKLSEIGLWDITIDGRMDEATVRTLIGQRLAAIPGFSKLSPERKRALIEADTERWYINERAMLEAALDHFVLDPEMAKKIGNIKFETKIPGRDAMDEASTHFYFGSESGDLRSQIRIDLPEIMNNQEAELPQLSDDERLRIDVVGAKNDAEAASTLSDFLVTVDGHSKTLAGMVEERAFARHVMKHEISHTIQGEAVAQMIKKQIEDKGSVSVRFSDGKIAEYSDIKDMPADAIIALMKRPSSDINLEALAKVVSRTDVVGFLAGDYPKMYFNDKDGLQLWAVEALAELWALRDLGIIYGDDIDAALEWMDNVSDGKYAPERIRQTNAAAAIKVDPPEAGSRPFRDTLVKSMSDAAKFKKQARKKELDKVKSWASNRDTEESQVFERAAHLAKIREDLVNEFVEAEKAGIPTDSPEMRRKAEKVFELDQESKALESSWISRFALSDSKNKSTYLKRFRSSVEEKRYTEGTLSKERMDEIRKERLISATKEAAQEMGVEELADLIVSQNISSMEKGITEEAKAEILEAKKAAMNVLREKVIREGDSKAWNKTRKDIQKRVDEIINPPDTSLRVKPKKFKGNKSAETYASEHFAEQRKKMTLAEVNALAELSDTNKTEIAQALWAHQRDKALESINRKNKNRLSEGEKIDPTSREQGSVDEQMKNILVPALKAIDKSVIDDDIEMVAIVPMPSPDEVGDIDATRRIELEGMITGDVVTDSISTIGGKVRNPDGTELSTGGKTFSRLVIQVPKGSRGTFPSWSFDRDKRGKNPPQKLTIPPGAIEIVETREDGTVVARVVEQKSAIETIEKFSIPRPPSAEDNKNTTDQGGVTRRAQKSAKKAVASKATTDLVSTRKEENPKLKKDNKPEPTRVRVSDNGNKKSSTKTPKPENEQNAAGTGRRTERTGKKATRTRTNQESSPEASGLSSGRSSQSERVELIKRKKSETAEKVANRAEDSKQDIEKLEKAIKELEENGRWIGGDLGIVLGMSRDTQTDTVHATGTAPNNRTKEQLADSLPQVIDAARIKLDRLKKEAELREFELKTKRIREEQGTLDLEDIPDEIRLELEEETKRLMAMLPEERQKYLQPEGWPDGVAVIHVGASELEDGVLNPGKTVGQRGAGGLESGAGNTGALNENAIDMQRAKIDGKRRRVWILNNIKDSDSETFTISTTDEKNALSEIGVIARVGDTVSISDFRDRIDATNELIEKEIERLEKPMKRLAESNMGFLSSYEFRGDIVSAGYFGRNNEKQIPHDVAEKYSEYEVAILKKKEKIIDSFMYDRWRRTLRGGAHLVIGKREEDISQQFGPSTEMQILGVNKPNFSYSARTFDRDEIDKVSTAIMARAMKLHREGKEITPEAVMLERLSS